MVYHNKQNAKRALIGMVVTAVLTAGLVLWLESTAYPSPAKLAAGIMVIQRGRMPLKGRCIRKWTKRERCYSRYLTGKAAAKLALRYAREATQVTSEERYKWLTPVDLLGLAANETDYRAHLVAEHGRYDARGWDCGITQNRASVFLGRTRKGRQLCNRLTKSSLLSFQYAARELTGYKNRYCARIRKRWGLKHWRFRKCVFNIYNQGPRYFRMGWLSRYYLRVKCYSTGILLQRRPRWSCRKVRDERWIRRAYRMK
jgi:hypothetical protein